MVVKNTTKLFTYWRRVVGLYVQIAGVKLGDTVRLDEHMPYILDIDTQLTRLMYTSVNTSSLSPQRARLLKVTIQQESHSVA